MTADIPPSVFNAIDSSQSLPCVSLIIYEGGLIYPAPASVIKTFTTFPFSTSKVKLACLVFATLTKESSAPLLCSKRLQN